MAHFVLEYSNNLKENDESIQRLLKSLHEAAEKTGLFAKKGVRSRAYRCDQHRMADGNPHHGFAHLEVKVRAGRPLEDRKSAADLFFEIYTTHFEHLYETRGVALSFEMTELEAVLKFNKNNLLDFMS